jgi:hypothetical protein
MLKLWFIPLALEKELPLGQTMDKINFQADWIVFHITELQNKKLVESSINVITCTGINLKQICWF